MYLTKSAIILCFSDYLKFLFLVCDRNFLSSFSLALIAAVSLIYPKSFVNLTWFKPSPWVVFGCLPLGLLPGDYNCVLLLSRSSQMLSSICMIELLPSKMLSSNLEPEWSKSNLESELTYRLSSSMSSPSRSVGRYPSLSFSMMLSFSMKEARSPVLMFSSWPS